MKVTFWGVRGSIATSGPLFAGIGGNTTCIEVTHRGDRLILDAGTGLRGLGDKLLQQSRATGLPVQANLLFTHMHWDHIQGFPFFSPAFMPSSKLSIWGAEGPDDEGVEQALAAQMSPPNFPVPLAAMPSQRTFAGLAPGETVQIGPFEVTARRLSHPQGVLGFRIEAGGKAVCFATDTEQPTFAEIDPELLALAKDADLLIHDAQYTEAQYAGEAGPKREGWGHSTYVAACRVAQAAGAQRLALFHHDPGHDDTMVEAIERDAKTHFAEAFAARENLSIDV